MFGALILACIGFVIYAVAVIFVTSVFAFAGWYSKAVLVLSLGVWTAWRLLE